MACFFDGIHSCTMEVLNLPKRAENQSHWAGEKPEDGYDETRL